MARSVEWLAQHRVQMVQSPSGATVLQIATNENWQPEDEEDYPGGVLESAREIPQAGRALAVALRRELGGALSLGAWVRREEAKRGGDGPGLARLAADLLGLAVIPKRVPKLAYRSQSADWKRYAAELRKLEEYRQGKYTSAAGARRARIAGLAGAQVGNPYRPIPGLGSVLEGYMIVLGARADWQISQDLFPFTLKHCLPQDPPSPAHQMLAAGGADLWDTLIAILTDEMGQEPLLGHDEHDPHVYSLQVQARPIRSRARPGPAGAPKPAPKPRKRKPGGGRRFVL